MSIKRYAFQEDRRPRSSFYG